jgi:hypothetical protein
VRYLAGQYLNAVARGVVTVSDADALFPQTNLYDGLPGQQFKFGTNGADRAVTVDLNIVANPGFETSTLASWTSSSTGTGTTAEELAIFHAGAKALKMGGGAAGVGSRYQDLIVRSGERRQLDCWLRGDAAVSARVRVQNLQTGKYLTSAGAWDAAAQDVGSQLAAAWAQVTRSYTVESYDTCQALTVTLRITLLCNQNGFGYADDVTDYPTLNFCGIFGHNVAPVVAPQFRSSTDNFGAVDTLEATLTPYQPTCFAYLSTPFTRRYARLKLSGTNVATPYLGELVLGYAEDAVTARAVEYDEALRLAQLRTIERSYVLRSKTSRQWQLPFRRHGTAATSERKEIFDRTAGGSIPLVLIPTNAGTDVAYGRIGDELKSRWLEGVVWEDSVVFEELPFASVVT